MVSSPCSSIESLSPAFALPELLAPAGNWECARAAVENGADAIYFGMDRFNARMRAENFQEADLPKLMQWLHRRGVRGYVTFNTLVFSHELGEAEQYLRTLIAAGVDAAIVQDVGLCRLIRHLSPDFPIHASTQMTVTSAAGVEFARDLGCQLVVLARECSLAEIRTIRQQTIDRGMTLPLEVFVHGALCVAYSGQCLTSEALGGRSANRGECAQACRMPYDLLADGRVIDLGDRKYLLSPQDLAGLDVLPELVQAGLASLKIEGRLKAPEYVANVTRVYRQALDRLGSPQRLQGQGCDRTGETDRYQLEMAFSRGLYTGWFKGIDNQALVHGRFGKKRGVYLGEVLRVEPERVAVQLRANLKVGDGVVFDQGQPDRQEVGGRIACVEVKGRETWLTFQRRDLNLRQIRRGDRLWKTNDPELDRQLRQSYAGEQPRFQQAICLTLSGKVGQPLVAIARDRQGHIVQVTSAMPLVAAEKQPLTDDRLREQWGRLGNTPFYLAEMVSQIQGEVLLPVSEINRMRREVVTRLEAQRVQSVGWTLNPSATLGDLLPECPQPSPAMAELVVLIRQLDQLPAVLQAGIRTIYCELEDPRRYRQVVEQVRQWGDGQVAVWVAPPRITKPGEQWILQQVRSAAADGYLLRNYDHLQFFAHDRCIGDFSLNIANPLTAKFFKQQYHLERLTASYDLNAQQLTDLLRQAPPHWFEVTIHQHMPMFHMEHCVFCAFLSTGTNYTNCGRPCEQHEVKLRDRVGTEHVLRADAGCRNTVFNGTAQTGAEAVQRLMSLGLRHFRLEFLQESGDRVTQILRCYQQLLRGEINGGQLWRELKLHNQLGVTRGTIAG